MKEENNEKNESSSSPLGAFQEGLPEELQGTVFKDEGELWKVQEKIGLSDLQIILNSEGFAVLREMPETKHRIGVSLIDHEFSKWKQEQGAVLSGQRETDVFLSDSFERNKKRCPDFAIWGPDRLTECGKIRVIANLKEQMNPHVIFQFSWGNKLEKEKLAIDDMSIYGGQGDDLAPLGKPKVLYLIKALQKGGSNVQPDSPVYGFDVYVVRQGERTAADPTLRYRVGGTEDITIVVAPEDMGLPHDANSFSFSLSDIRVDMEEVGVVFEAENQDE
jgi:hypothetical protein